MRQAHKYHMCAKVSNSHVEGKARFGKGATSKFVGMVSSPKHVALPRTLFEIRRTYHALSSNVAVFHKSKTQEEAYARTAGLELLRSGDTAVLTITVNDRLLTLS